MEQTIHWQDLLRALPDVAWVKDLLGQYQACNLRFETLLGLSESEILGKTDLDLKTPALAPFFEALSKNDTTPTQLEVTFAQDQHQEYLEVQQIPIHNTHKQAIGSLGIGRNITYLHELLESMQDGFVALDADWRYRYVNQQAAQFLNHSPASLLGKNIWQVFPEGVGESFEAAYHTAMSTRQTLRIESYFAPWRCWFENRIYPTQTGISIFFTDITEQKERELQEQMRLNIFEKLLQGEPLQTILAALITAYEQLFPETVCSILLVNTRNQTLNWGVAPHLPEYVSKALDKLPLTSGKGPCCTAALTGKTVITENIQDSPWSENYKALLHKAGLVACWSEPILGTDKQVLGTFAIYRAQVGLPSEAEKKFIASVVQLASLALERNKTTHLLSESENSYRTLINTIPDLVWLKDPQGRYLMCNSRFEALFGASEADIKNKTDFDFVNTELAEFFRAHDQAVLNAGKSHSNEEELTFQSDGYTGIFETIKTPMVSQEGEVLGVLGVARDISKTKSALQSLQEREALIATMFNQTTDSILLVNPETQKFVDFNDTACQNLGYSREEFSQLHVGDIQAALGPDKRGQLVHAVQSGQSFNFETHHRRKDGNIREIELTLRPIALAGEKLISAVWRDITEAKEAKAELDRYHHHLEELVNSRTQALQASEYRFRKLVEDIKQDYIFFSVGEGQCITYLSPSAEEFFGQEMEAMLGKPWYEVFQLGASAQKLGEQIMLQMQKGENPPPFEIEVELGGQKQTLEITEHIRYSPTGNLLGGEGVIKNITRQKRIEAELREAKDKAEKASQAKSLFLANMSHEIRTPLNVILGFSEMMQEKMQDSRYQNFLQAINSSGKNLLNIINDILDLSKIEAGKLQLTLQNVSLKALFQDLDILLRFSFEKKKPQLSFNPR
ncbi:MAG: PAS domain S-box protein [Candidatus Sericytochromatia bacterium]|nr:PAS domain S-box protein [Candidatus Sericytochromatia bacterium]